jgi:uncharacterized membrane protein HdeD (DUF308 family)
VTVFSPAWRQRGNRVLLALAGALGALMGFVLTWAPQVARLVPAVVGPLFIAYGLGLAWRPLGFMAIGMFLLWADRNIR